MVAAILVQLVRCSATMRHVAAGRSQASTMTSGAGAGNANLDADLDRETDLPGSGSDSGSWMSMRGVCIGGSSSRSSTLRLLAGNASHCGAAQTGAPPTARLLRAASSRTNAVTVDGSSPQDNEVRTHRALCLSAQSQSQSQLQTLGGGLSSRAVPIQMDVDADGILLQGLRDGTADAVVDMVPLGILLRGAGDAVLRHVSMGLLLHAAPELWAGTRGPSHRN